MTDMKRRRFLALVASVPMGAALHDCRSAIVVEAEHASAFFAPYVAERLVAGRPLDLSEHGHATYLSHDGYLMARLPNRIGGRVTGLRATVQNVARDEDGRLRLFVRLTQA